MFRKSALAAVAVLIGLGSITVPACADTVLFSDDFNSGASPAWSNTLGNWTASGGAYRAQNPNNFPNTYSFVNTLPSLTDFSITVDVNAARDGGVWLRANSDPTFTVGVAGGLRISATLLQRHAARFTAGRLARAAEGN